MRDPAECHLPGTRRGASVEEPARYWRERGATQGYAFHRLTGWLRQVKKCVSEPWQPCNAVNTPGRRIDVGEVRSPDEGGPCELVLRQRAHHRRALVATEVQYIIADIESIPIEIDHVRVFCRAAYVLGWHVRLRVRSIEPGRLTGDVVLLHGLHSDPQRMTEGWHPAPLRRIHQVTHRPQSRHAALDAAASTLPITICYLLVTRALGFGGTATGAEPLCGQRWRTPSHPCSDERNDGVDHSWSHGDHGLGVAGQHRPRGPRVGASATGSTR